MSKYELPAKNSLVVGHVNPDGDSLSSIRAVVNYLHSKDKMAVVKLSGAVPEHLSWILDEDDLIRKVPEIEQTIVLDCAPTEERIGFAVHGPIVNIDHHITRKKEHDPDNNIYVLKRCSTAAALILDFGIIDEILLVGLWTDTMFINDWREVLKVAGKLKLSDERAKEILTAIRPIRYTKALLGIKNAKFHRCRNGFLIVETDEDDQTVVAEMMDTLFRYSEHVCLVDSSGQARLRTSNKDLIESGKIAEISHVFGGGGHNFSAGMHINGKRKALFAVIKQLEILHNEEESEKKDEQHHEILKDSA
jgi:nanoRNase/pAp phosphatase (c-di-AMP/oligoRNAs hydrolase)